VKVTDRFQVFYTGGSLNPTRSFGPCVILHTFEDYHWIYWVGPILGSIVAAGFYKFIKILEYETVNPGQDVEAQAFDPEKGTPRSVPVAPETNASDSTEMLGRGGTSYTDRAGGLHGAPIGRTAYPTSGGTTYPVRSAPPSKLAAGAVSAASTYPTGEGYTNNIPEADPVGVHRGGAAIEPGTYAPESTARP
jgi:hypothetical protein